MRLNFLLLVGFLAPVAIFAGRQDAPKPKKVLTPEQQVYQQESKQLKDKRDQLRAAAKQAFNAEMAREKGGTCPDARTTYEANICLAHEEETTGGNYKAYADAVRAFLGLQEPTFPGSQQEPRLSTELSQEQFVAEFDQTQHLWEAYRGAQCSAVFHQFRGGTGAPSAETECQLRMIRGHMRDIDYVYNVMLYH